jgi:integration host factor subunit beta
MATTKKREKAPTITKKELIDRIAEVTDAKRVVVKRIIQKFLDSVVDELAKGNRLEFRDFGVFETRMRKARQAQNPKTMEKVPVPEKRTVKFKVGRIMKQRLAEAARAAMMAAMNATVNSAPRDGRDGRDGIVSGRLPVSRITAAAPAGGNGSMNGNGSAPAASSNGSAVASASPAPAAKDTMSE